MTMASNRALALLLCFSLSALSVAAVGFGDLPGNREVIYRPGTEVRIPFYVINGEHIDVTLSTAAPQHPETIGTPEDDNIVSYAAIADPAPRTGDRIVEVVFRFPDHQLRPGTYPVDVYATDVRDIGGATVTAVATVKFRLTVWVLSPEPLIHVTGVSAEPIAEGLRADATVWYISRTLQDLTATTEVRVMKGNSTLATATGDPRLLPSGKADTATLSLPTEGLAGGEYEMYATVRYGDAAEGGPAVLKIGTLHVAIPSYTGELRYNETNRFRFNVSNQWNRELKKVYASLSLGAQEKTTASLDIPPFGQTEYEVYFDRDDGLLPGPAVMNATVTFQDYDTRQGQYVDKTESFGLPVSIVVPPAVEQPLALRDVLTWGLGIAVIALLALLFALRRRRTPPVQEK